MPSDIGTVAPSPRPQLSQQQTDQLMDEIAGPGRPLDVLTFLRGIQLEYTGAQDGVASGDFFEFVAILNFKKCCKS